MTLTATVNPSSATGVVTFYDGPAVLGESSVSAGQALLTTSLLATGKRQLFAYFAAAPGNPSGTSTVLVQTVNAVSSRGLSGPASLPARHNIVAMATADFNGDGKTDLVTVNSDLSIFGVILGNVNGTFQNRMDSEAGAPFPNAVATGDFDGDGNTDLALVSGYGSTVMILLGKGNGLLSLTGRVKTLAFRRRLSARARRIDFGDGISAGRAHCI